MLGNLGELRLVPKCDEVGKRSILATCSRGSKSLRGEYIILWHECEPSLLSPMVGLVLKPEFFLCLLMLKNLGTFHLSTSRSLDQADQPCIHYIPGINAIMWTAKSALTFSISERILSQHIAFTTFSSILLLSWQCKGSKKNFCQSLDHGRTTTKRERPTRLTLTDLCLHWYVKSDRIHVQLPDLQSHYCKGSEKNSGHSLSIDLWVPPLFLSDVPWEEEQSTAKAIDGYSAIVGAQTHSSKLLLIDLPISDVVLELPLLWSWLEVHPAHGNCTCCSDDEDIPSQKPWQLLLLLTIQSRPKCKSLLG